MNELIGLIAREVRIRFDLSADQFIARVEQLARAHSHHTGRALDEQASRLNLDDLYLATACTRGDERAWQELSAAHFEFMRQFARRFLSAADAREVADEVIADLWERGRLGQYEGRSTLRTWLGTVVAHAALNSRKARSRLVSMERAPTQADDAIAVPIAGVEPPDERAATLLREFLAAALRELPAENRLLLQLYYEQGLTLDELGVTLRASSAAISRRLKRTREALRATIESLSHRHAGTSADALREGLDLGRIEVDLGRLLGSESGATGDRYGVV